MFLFLVLYRLGFQAGVSPAFGIWLHVRTSVNIQISTVLGSQSTLVKADSSAALFLVQCSQSLARYEHRFSNELVTRLEKDRRRDAGKKPREGEESHFSYKHSQEGKIKSIQKLF